MTAVLSREMTHLRYCILCVGLSFQGGCWPVLATGAAALAADLPMVGRLAARVSAEPLLGTPAPLQYAAACSYDSC
jgi:hypothetical protein